MPHLSGERNIIQGRRIVSNFLYRLYLLYLASYLLHLTARASLFAVIRLDLVLFLMITILLVLESDKLKERIGNECSSILGILLLYIVISLPFVEWPGSVLRNNLSEFIKAIAFFFFTILIIDNERRLKGYVSVFVICELFRVLEPLYLHLVYGYWGSATYIGTGEFADRLSGAPSDIINPNGLAFVIATVYPFIHYLWNGKNKLGRMAYVAVTPMLLYAMVLTMSRSGLVALAVIGWNIWIHSRHKLFMVGMAVLATSLLWANMTDYQKDRYLSLTGTKEARSSATFYGRLSGFSEGFVIIMNKPIVGHGLGTSREANYNLQSNAHVTHILYYEIWIELGLIGLVIFLVFLRRIYRALNEAKKELSRILDLYTSLNQVNHQRDVILYKNLLKILISCFWMFLIFSFSQYGLSEIFWYLLAGLSVVLLRMVNIAKTERETQLQSFSSIGH